MQELLMSEGIRRDTPLPKSAYGPVPDTVRTAWSSSGRCSCHSSHESGRRAGPNRSAKSKDKRQQADPCSQELAWVKSRVANWLGGVHSPIKPLTRTSLHKPSGTGPLPLPPLPKPTVVCLPSDCVPRSSELSNKRVCPTMRLPVTSMGVQALS